ncbi:serine/threonine-protein kinase/endoribonuclease ire1 [Plakobranchus ocellatus]|uniref:Serine/threonine-protein kinase/endoribonuclease ire1 n=1 Tax=Plakobranchus ocellatus TaxID=259542 RepID=A0AAV4A6Z2_9GAST|nr:serine/threonine-protein kinase/endoribonuclease ire1 [Plakobranchus ocellatus]
MLSLIKSFKEADSQFRYIALELCAATVQDYIEQRYSPPIQLKAEDILYQAMAGIKHLHSLDIVHRDVKPHNVLISLPNSKNEVRCMISDFGLCKKLAAGRYSFSRRSGAAGTEGWIAPEMLDEKQRTTCAVDIFSMGCLFYYVLTEGRHPFGESLRRQANILCGDYNFKYLPGDEHYVSRKLIERMIAFDPDKRPSAQVILEHPFFWSTEKQLAFFQVLPLGHAGCVFHLKNLFNFLTRRSGYFREFQSISDYVLICPVDLRKFRSYRGTSVRDLLRAMRNKKHHYRQLPDPVKKTLGSVPDEFVSYFTSRFPQLLLHVYTAMECCSYERIMHPYYAIDAGKLARIEEERAQEEARSQEDFPSTVENGPGGDNGTDINEDLDVLLGRGGDADITKYQHEGVLAGLEASDPEKSNILQDQGKDILTLSPNSPENLPTTQMADTLHLSQTPHPNNSDIWPRGQSVDDVVLLPTSHLRPTVPKALQKSSPSPHRRRAEPHEQRWNSPEHRNTGSPQPQRRLFHDSSPSKDGSGSPSPRARHRRYQRKKASTSPSSFD